MKDINLKNKKKIDNNCQCLCHFDTKQLLSSVKYCDRCIEIHKTEPISPFKPNGWEETEKVLLKSFRDSCVIGFHTIGIGTVPCWINDVIKPLLATKETKKKCENCEMKPGKVIRVDDIYAKDMKCADCGKKLKSFEVIQDTKPSPQPEIKPLSEIVKRTMTDREFVLCVAEKVDELVDQVNKLTRHELIK